MIGFLIENCNDQQMAQAINMISQEKPCVVFSESATPGLQCNVLQKLEAFHFNGTIITNSIRLAQQMANLGYAQKRYLYLQGTPWQNIDNLHLSHLENTVLNENIDLIIDNGNNKTLIYQITNKEPKYVMPNWDLNVLREIANE